MKQKTRKVLHGLSVAGLVAAGSIPLMAVDAKSDKNADKTKADTAAKAKDNAAAPKKCAASTANKAKAKSNANTKAGQKK